MKTKTFTIIVQTKWTFGLALQSLDKAIIDTYIDGSKEDIDKLMEEDYYIYDEYIMGDLGFGFDEDWDCDFHLEVRDKDDNIVYEISNH